MGTPARTLATCLALAVLTVLARPDASACVHENLDWAEGLHGTYSASVDVDYTGQCDAVDGAWVHVVGEGTVGTFRDETTGEAFVDPVVVRVWISGMETGDWVQASWSSEESGPIDVWLHLQSLDGPTPEDLMVEQPIRIGIALNDCAMAGFDVEVEPMVDLTLVGLHAGSPVSAEPAAWGDLKTRYR